jgi:hypothetical protein
MVPSAADRPVRDRLVLLNLPEGRHPEPDEPVPLVRWRRGEPEQEAADETRSLQMVIPPNPLTKAIDGELSCVAVAL